MVIPWDGSYNDNEARPFFGKREKVHVWSSHSDTSRCAPGRNPLQYLLRSDNEDFDFSAAASISFTLLNTILRLIRPNWGYKTSLGSRTRNHHTSYHLHQHLIPIMTTQVNTAAVPLMENYSSFFISGLCYKSSIVLTNDNGTASSTRFQRLHFFPKWTCWYAPRRQTQRPLMVVTTTPTLRNSLGKTCFVMQDPSTSFCHPI